ncbi:hypothetical protein HDV01_002871 [Terramyces sp. JEL0728]|nr:hypothetical protein HDV01_002871 [Terramyces sp. JEL0728]
MSSVKPDKGPTPELEQTVAPVENTEREKDLKLQDEIVAKVEQIQNQQNIKKAVDFLSNPKVIAAPKEEKIKFLKGKGLTDLEIQTAFDQLQSSPNTTSNTVAPGPPIEFGPSTTPAIPPGGQSKQVVQKKKNRFFLLIYLLPIIGGGTWVAYQIKKWLQAVYVPFIELYKKQVEKRLASTSAYFQNAFSLCTLYKSVLDCDEGDASISKSFKEMIYSVSKNISKVNSLLQDVGAMPNIYKEMSQESQNFTQQVRQATYYPAYSTYHTEANAIKSEIRSLKGILLSRRNFPTVAKVNK